MTRTTEIFRGLIRRQRGGALLAVLGFAALVSALILLALTESQGQIKQVDIENDHGQAIAAAEIGLEAALFRLRKGQLGDLEGSIPTFLAASNGNGNGNGGGGGAVDQDNPGQGNVDEDLLTVFPVVEDEGEVAPDSDAAALGQGGGPTDSDGDGFIDFLPVPTFQAQRALYASQPSGTLSVRVNTVAPNTHRVRSMAVEDGVVRVLETIIRPVATPAIGIVALGDLRFNAQVLIDSYDSSVAPYNATSKPVVVNGSAILDSNGNPVIETYDRAVLDMYAGGSFFSNSNVTALGDLQLGPSATVTGPDVLGATTNLLTPISVPTPVYNPPAGNDNGTPGFDNFSDASGDFALINSQSTTLGSDGATSNFEVTNNLSLGTGTELVVRGDVTLYVSGTSTFGSDSTLTLAPGASLNLVAQGAVAFGSSVNYQSAQLIPADFQINQTTAAGITISANNDIYAVINAPLASIQLNSNIDIYGSIIGGDIRANSNVRFHYDEALASSSPTGTRLVITGVVELR